MVSCAPNEGDHEIWYSPIHEGHLTVDEMIESRHTPNGVPRQAGVRSTSRPGLAL